MSIDESLPIATQIAEALEYAHEHGMEPPGATSPSQSMSPTILRGGRRSEQALGGRGEAALPNVEYGALAEHAAVPWRRCAEGAWLDSC